MTNADLKLTGFRFDVPSELTKPNFMGYTRKYSGDCVFHKEVGYGGEIEWTWVATVNHEKKQARPTHGYFCPHKTGNKLKKYFTKIGYEFISR